MAHRMLVREARAIAHEVDHEIARRDRDPDIRRADRKRRLGEHLGDAHGPARRVLRYHGIVGHESVLQLRTARSGRAHPHHVPVVLEGQPGSFVRPDEEGQNRGPLRRLLPQRLGEEVIHHDALGAENLAPVDDKPAVHPARGGARPQTVNRIVGLRTRPAADQPPLAIARSLSSTLRGLNLWYKSISRPIVLKCMLIANAVAPHPWARRSWALIALEQAGAQAAQFLGNGQDAVAASL